ncbi:MAG TPA: hypothetical protein VF050_12960 [Moraxellaceae bacterium]
MRKLGFGIVWFFALSMAALMAGGFVVGFQAGLQDTGNAQAAGQAAGQAFGQKYGGIIFLSALVIATVGSIFGWLPGTRSSEAP